MEKRFEPGFRISVLDSIVLATGALATELSMPSPFAFLIAYVVVHFFLFCNVFRIARNYELSWSAVFLALAVASLGYEIVPRSVALGTSLLTTILVIGLEMRKPSYHGVLWQRINPSLKLWCEGNSEF